MRTAARLHRRFVAMTGIACAVALTFGAGCNDDNAASSGANQASGRQQASRSAAPGSVTARAAAPVRQSGGDAVVSTIAGAGGRGFGDGAARDAVFNRPAAVVTDVFGSVFVADEGNDLIRQVTPDGLVSTYAGSGVRGFADGPRRIARFNAPGGIALDLAGNMYVADSGNDLIRKVAPDGSVTTVAGNGVRGFTNGRGREAQFNTPSGIAIDGGGNLYVADTGNDLIRKVAPDGNVTTVAGAGVRGFADGPAAAAQFNQPSAVAIDGAGILFIADKGNDLVRKVTPDGAVSTVAGGERGFADGSGRAARFNTPSGITVDPSGNLYVADTGNDGVRRITPDGVVTLFAGAAERGFADGLGRAAQFNEPVGVALDAQGNLYIADLGNNLVRKITFGSAVTVFAGSGARGYADGGSRAAVFNRPIGIAVDSAGVAYVTDAGNDVLRKITPDGNVTTFAGSGERGFTDGALGSARFNAPAAIALDGAGNFYVADAGNDLIRKIAADGSVSTFAGSGERGFGNGAGRAARFNNPTGLALDSTGSLYVADSGNDVIRRITPDGTVTTFAGSGERGYRDGAGDAAQFNTPTGIVIDPTGNLYVADAGNDLIRRIASDGVVTTIAGGQRGFTDGQGAAAQFNMPVAIAIDSSGVLYVVDQGNDLIRRLGPDGAVSTVVGSGERGFTDGARRAAQFNAPSGIALDGGGNLYIVDQGNDLVRKVTADQ